MENGFFFSFSKLTRAFLRGITTVFVFVIPSRFSNDDQWRRSPRCTTHHARTHTHTPQYCIIVACWTERRTDDDGGGRWWSEAVADSWTGTTRGRSTCPRRRRRRRWHGSATVQTTTTTRLRRRDGGSDDDDDDDGRGGLSGWARVPATRARLLHTHATAETTTRTTIAATRPEGHCVCDTTTAVMPVVAVAVVAAAADEAGRLGARALEPGISAHALHGTSAAGSRGRRTHT